jgi:uncharacterized protein
MSGTVTLPTLGAARADGETAVVWTRLGSSQVRSAGYQVELPEDPHQDAPGWQGLRRVRTGSLDVLLEDLDPFRMRESGSLAPRLTVAQADAFAEGLRNGWQVLESHHPVVAVEIATIVTVIVPYLAPAEGQVSASAAENFGAVALSSSDDPSLCAAILAHEIQHLKLSAVLDLVSLTRPDGDQRFYAPWRTDPRPVSGLLQGAYAFLGVSAFWRRQRHFEEGRARRYQQGHVGGVVLRLGCAPAYLLEPLTHDLPVSLEGQVVRDLGPQFAGCPQQVDARLAHLVGLPLPPVPLVLAAIPEERAHLGDRRPGDARARRDQRHIDGCIRHLQIVT